MCDRVSLSSKLFSPSIRKSYANGFGRNKDSRFNSRKGIPKEWRSPTRLCGYPVNPVTGSVQKQIVNALYLGERGKASSLLSQIGRNKHMLRANHFVQILKYCALTPDPLFVMEIWKTMEEKGIDMNNKCHALMIQAFCKGGYLEEAFNLMCNCAETQYLYPTLRKYNTLLGASAEKQSVSHTSKCLDLMDHDMMGKDEVTYTELLKLAVMQKNLSAVHSIWKEYTKYYSFNLISLRKFIWSFTRLGDLETALEALRHLVNSACQGRFTVKISAEEKMIIPRLDIPIPFFSTFEWSRPKKDGMTAVPSIYEMGHGENNIDNQKVSMFDMNEVRSVGMVVGSPKNIPVTRILRLSFTDVIHACLRPKKHELAEQLFFQMQNLGVEPSRGAYDGLIRVLIKQRGLQDGMEVLKLMQQKSIKPLDSTLAAISVGCIKSLELDLAEAFLDQIAKCTSARPYNKLLEACDTLDQPERGVRVFGKMKQLKIAPTIKTYEFLFSLFGNVNAPYENGNILSQAEAAKRINLIEDDMVRSGIQHSYLSMRNLLKALGSEGMISGLLHYLRVAETQFTPGTPIYNIVLHSLIEANEGQMAINVFKTLIAHHGYRPNDVTFTIMIDCCAITGSYKSAQGLTAMMIRHGYPPQVQTYTALVKLVLALGDFDEALTLLNQACIKGIHLDALLFNTILKEAAWKDRIDIIEIVMDRMHKEKVAPDPETCGYVFSAYVDGGFYNTAMEALQVMSIHMFSNEEIDEKKTVFEEEFIYAEDSEAESRALDLFKDSKENLSVALLNLRWCAMVGNPISWSTNESPWVKRISSTNCSR